MRCSALARLLMTSPTLPEMMATDGDNEGAERNDEGAAEGEHGWNLHLLTLVACWRG